MTFNLKSLKISGKEVFPIIEGGKGIGVSNGLSSGAFAKAGAVGTFSGVNADFYDENGKLVEVIYHGKTRKEKHLELINYGIQGGIAQAKIARDIAGNNGAIHMNILWEMGGAIPILEGILAGAKGLIDGITCGAGMPYKVAEISAEHNIFYYPIVSSMRAFRALWKRSYHKFAQHLGAVVYEDPWKAGGHNGLSNVENPTKPEDPYPRVALLRKYMNEVGLENTPIVMAGGAWHLKDWEHWLDNKEIGPIAFQFGTRPVVTKESPVSNAWKKKLLNLKEGDVFLNRFSPTGFYSSAVNNDFIKELREREERQIKFFSKNDNGQLSEFKFGARGRSIYIAHDDLSKANDWLKMGYTSALKTPDDTIIFVTPEKAQQITKDQIDCMGCLSACKFSNWYENEDAKYTTGKKPDPRSFCIQKTLQKIIHEDDVENQLLFSGHNAYKFATDPFYANGNIPTVQELVERIKIGL